MTCGNPGNGLPTTTVKEAHGIPALSAQNIEKVVFL